MANPGSPGKMADKTERELGAHSLRLAVLPDALDPAVVMFIWT